MIQSQHSFQPNAAAAAAAAANGGDSDAAAIIIIISYVGISWHVHVGTVRLHGELTRWLSHIPMRALQAAEAQQQGSTNYVLMS